MPKLVFDTLPPLTDKEIAAAVGRNVVEELQVVVVSAALYTDNLEFVQNLCVQLASHPNAIVRGNAILGFGHLARRFPRLDESVVRPIIEDGIRSNIDYIRGQAFDAAEDAEHYLGWKFA